MKTSDNDKSDLENADASQSDESTPPDVVGPEKYRLIGNIFVVPGKALDPPEPIRHRPKVNRED